MSSPASGRICVGAVAGAFGVRGEVRLKPFTDDPAAIAAYGPLETEDGARRFTLTLTRDVKGGLAGRLSGVTSREQAEALKGTRLYAPRAALPESADEDEFYHADLIGMAVVGLDGALLGAVLAVQNYGAGDLLEIRLDGEEGSVLLPFTRDVAPEVDLVARRIVIDPPEGALSTTDEREPEDEADPDDEG